MTQSVNESVSDGGDCRTAPATPGLLKSKNSTILFFLPTKVNLPEKLIKIIFCQIKFQLLSKATLGIKG